MNNKQRITLLSFLAYFVMSGMLAPMGIISGPMSEHFGESVTQITASFGWLTMGNLTGAIIALFIFDWARLRHLMTGVYVLIVASVLVMALTDNLLAVGIAMGIVGACCGVGLAGAALIISRTYDTERRASMLVITDGAFSVAGIVCSWLAIFLLARHFHWSGTYQFVALIAAVIVALTLTSRLPEAQEESVAQDSPRAPWPVGVWLCLAALFLYTLGQWSFLLWLPNYAETQLGAAQDRAGQVVSQFWTGMFAAQIFVAWWVLKIGVRRLVSIAAISTLVFSVPLWNYTGIEGLIVLSVVWGFANFSLLKITLSFATQLVPVPSARLVSSLLLGATIGTAVSPRVTSWIVEATSNYFILVFGSLAYALMMTLLLLAVRSSKSKGVAVNEEAEAL